ncbi:MAG: hypothetical protein M3Q56_07045 [Bacteroidota bacterium]|nr:hypothetical protein [Bacteroidota bacterium]
MIIKCSQRLSLFLSSIFILTLLGCLGERPVMTPTDFSNIILKAAFTKDSALIKRLIPTRTKCMQTMALGKIGVNEKERELKYINDNENMQLVQDSVMYYYRNLLSKIEKYNIKEFKFDTVDFNNYFDSRRPYLRLDVNGFINQDTNKYIFVVHGAFLMTDGWNLGMMDIVPPEEVILIRTLDQERARILSERLAREKLKDSLDKINLSSQPKNVE